MANRLVERLDLKGVESHLPLAAAADQAGIAEDSQLVRDAGLRHPQASGEGTGRTFALAQSLQYGPPRGIRQGLKKHQPRPLRLALVDIVRPVRRKTSGRTGNLKLIMKILILKSSYVFTSLALITTVSASLYPSSS